MSIWKVQATLEELNTRCQGTLVEHLGIEVTELGDDYMKGTMPVNDQTRQYFGVLHGGANVALSESLGSIASNLCIDQDKYYCVGLEVNANHVKAVPSGLVTGVAKPLHLGGKTQVWDIVISDEEGNTSCISRLTMAVLRK